MFDPNLSALSHASVYEDRVRKLRRLDFSSQNLQIFISGLHISPTFCCGRKAVEIQGLALKLFQALAHVVDDAARFGHMSVSNAEDGDDI